MSYLQQVKKAIPQAPVITIVGFPGVGKSTTTTNLAMALASTGARSH